MYLDVLNVKQLKNLFYAFATCNIQSSSHDNYSEFMKFVSPVRHDQ